MSGEIEAYGAFLRAFWRAWGLDIDGLLGGDRAPAAPSPRAAPAPAAAEAPPRDPGCSAPGGRAAYDLRAAGNEIDAVAGHAAALVDHVAALGEAVRALDGLFDARLERFKRDVLDAVDGRLADARRVASGDGRRASHPTHGAPGERVPSNAAPPRRDG